MPGRVKTLRDRRVGEGEVMLADVVVAPHFLTSRTPGLRNLTICWIFGKEATSVGPRNLEVVAASSLWCY